MPRAVVFSACSHIKHLSLSFEGNEGYEKHRKFATILSLQVNNSYITQHGGEILGDLLKCQFADYVHNATSISKESVELYHSWKYKTFDSKSEHCKELRPSLTSLEGACVKHKYVGAKIISMTSMRGLVDLLASNVKVIHLVRDPRSAWLSRAKLEEKNLTTFTHPCKTLQKQTHMCHILRALTLCQTWHC